MSLSKEEKEHIKTYFLISQGLEITEVTEFHNYLLLKPYGVIPFEDKIYIKKQILQELYLSDNGISDISLLSNLSNLKSENNISDLSPLSNLTNLKILNLRYNKIIDISPLSNLSKLEKLYLQNNNISDISPLSTLSNLKYLDLCYNKIEDISPLSNLTNLKYLNLHNNNISKEQIKKLQCKLPNCYIYT